mmetsp:Transcript_16771/g.54845  ORF Transcript_16771/g.54845 Transcript_16771/m.54845 type:complete len:205 (+) Transcript_16771:200-814(+)|eukprot:CAMPEP_0170134932 /NCGR_PEP_ID=MMETSP0033_2-20121228/2200_1 /TAXON_ID=195969 /ORGANISM="Dolichomastix tenuilepis, Strain CCMP3274" /LENGTH=204 /DNA_ID=CAMNT_0010370521 /DNA_START=200 /DNA_END=814 /DNA_ORIENTATION=+
MYGAAALASKANDKKKKKPVRALQNIDLEQEWESMPELLQKTIMMAFQAIDKDDSNSISKDELRDVLMLCGSTPTSEDMTDYFTKFDLNTDNSLGLYEFAFLWKSTQMLRENESTLVRRAFHYLDQDANGLLTQQEMVTTMQQLGLEDPLSEEEVATFFKLADRDQNGSLDVEEFMQLLATEDTASRQARESVPGGEFVAGGNA